MIRWAVLLLPFCVLVTAFYETDGIPQAFVDLATEINNNKNVPKDYKFEPETDHIDENMFDILLASHPFHSEDRRQMRDNVRKTKKTWRQRKVKPHTLPSL